MTNLRDQLRAALPAAMKSRDRAAVAALRSTLSTLDNAEAIKPPEGTAGGQAIEQVAIGVGTTEVERRVLSEAEVAELIKAEIVERESAATGYDRAGRTEKAAELRAEAAVLAPYLVDYH